jgi:acetyl esterase/lipase
VFSIHGGGYVMGSRDLDDAHLGRRAAELGWIGASVEYRLAPSTPYPGPLDDCFAAYTWLHAQAGALGIDPALTGVAGTSAGGGLAAALTLLARERGVALPAFQLLEAPMIDDRCRTASSRLAGLPVWDGASNEFGWRSYLGDLYGAPDVPQFAAAARAVDLEGLPPTFVNVGTIDGFRDEAIEFATRLNQSGVPTELHVYAGAPHGFQLFADAAVSRRAAREVDAWLQRLAGEESAG